jgi:hypothetical protein
MGTRTTKAADSALSGLEALTEAALGRRLILFVGGGASQNLGVPGLQTLVRHIAKDLKIPTKTIKMTDYPVIAEAYLLKHGKLGSLRSWMDETWHPPSIQIERSELHTVIVDLNFPVIYTTNYDRWLERAFEAHRKPYRKISNVADLAASSHGETEIIKFHRDFEDDDSLVLTESSYFQRMLFESPLDIRLRSDCLARPLLFVGYSLHDVNTRYLLFRLQELWRSSPHASQRPLSYILMSSRDPAQQAVLRSRGVEPIVLEDEDTGRAATSFLTHLRDAVI